MTKGKWDGKMMKENECGDVTPLDPNSLMDEELAMLLRTALAGPKQKRKDAPKNIPLELLIVLRKKKIPVKAIARICKCTPQNVRKRLAGKLRDIRMIDEYKNNRADVLAYQQRRILSAVSDDDIGGAGLKDKAISFGILYDKERLETGKGIGGGNLVVAVINFGDMKPKGISINPPIDIKSISQEG